MWTTNNRARYDRSFLRYPSDLTDDEWALVEPLIPPAKRGGDKRTVIMREVVNGLMYILSTGFKIERGSEPPSASQHQRIETDKPCKSQSIHISANRVSAHTIAGTAPIKLKLKILNCAFVQRNFCDGGRRRRFHELELLGLV